MGTVELEQAPRLPALYGRAALGMLPRRGGAGDALPDTELMLRGVMVDRARLAEYVRVCGFRLSDTLPPTYPHVLAFPLGLRLLTAPEFPFPAAGVVHVANRIEVRRPLDAGEPLDFAVRAEDLRPHDRGRQFDVVAVASAEGTEVWRGVSTYLRRQRSGGSGGERRDRREPSGPPGPSGPSGLPGPSGPSGVPEPSAVWRISPRVATAYAAVSGDRNPIHTSLLAARVLGFRRRIAHGMWTKARCLAQLSVRLPEAYAVEVAFKAPVELPATVGFSASADLHFALHSVESGKPHLSGAVSRLTTG